MYFPSLHMGGGIRYSLLRTHRRLSKLFKAFTFGFIDNVVTWGQTSDMRRYERQKLAIFNQINIFQAILGITILAVCLKGKHPLSVQDQVSLFLPIGTHVLVLMLNRSYQYEAARTSYFLLAPILTSFIYTRGLDFGFDLSFILYGVLSVFFLRDLGWMIFSVGLSMMSYFILSVVWTGYSFRLEDSSPLLYMLIQVIQIAMIFYGLYLIKKENAEYQSRVLHRNRQLKTNNLEIERINEELNWNAIQLEEQARKLEDLNRLKDKLFSVISHDLKAPIHALKNIFTYIHDHKLPAKEIKGLIPDVVSEINNTKELMDNLLQWAKSQMEGARVRSQAVDMHEMVMGIQQLLRPLAQAKKINIECNLTPGLYAIGDWDMVNLVVRNLVSNAIKFTPTGGKITLDARSENNVIEIYVRDTGTGIEPEKLDQILSGNFYTSKGTANESGTGLGLMLCREFISKNGGQLNIISQPGAGSVFSFTLRSVEEKLFLEGRLTG